MKRLQLFTSGSARRASVWIVAAFALSSTAIFSHALRAQSNTASQAPNTQQAPSSPQPPSPVPQSSGKVSVETKIVTLYAAVRDKHGKIVPTLNKADFTINEDGKPQTISYFAQETDLPLTLGLLVDTSLSQAKVLDSERDASYTFLDHMMRQDKDKAFVIHFDREVELLQDITGSKPKLQAGLQLLAIEQQDSSDDDNQGQGRGRGFRGGTHLYDAVYLATHDVLATQKGRKAVFVLTDGVDRGSKETLEEAIEAAQRADTAVYAIYFSGGEPDMGPRFGHGGGMGRGGYPGGGWPGGGGGGGGRRYPEEQRVDGKKILERMATETGGQMFEISKKLPIDQAYAEAEEELRNQYSLGYTPNPPDTDAGYHRIQVTVDQKEDSVQARNGYYSD